MPAPRAGWGLYVLALAATLLTLKIRLLMSEVAGDRPVLVLFIIPIILSAYWGGVGPGLLATLVTCAGTAFFLFPPRYSFAISDPVAWWQLWIVGMTGILISVICEWLHRLRWRAERVIEELRNKEAELKQALRAAEDLRTALDDHAIVAVTDARGKITFVNDKFCAISGYSREELLGKDHRIINSGHHPKEFFRDLWTTIASGKPWHGEIRNRAKDGIFYWVATTIVPFLDEAGKPRQYIAIRADITGHKRAEEALRASELRYRTLFDYAPDGIVIADGRSTYLDANVSACRMLGYARGELVGLNAVDIVMPAEFEHIEPALRAIQGGADYQREWRFRRKDGSIFPAEVIATAMPDGNLMGMIRDITERKRGEAEIHRLNSQLEQRVEERTAQLESANRELEAFSYSVSHDLRAPLRTVAGFAQAVVEDYGPLLPDEARRDLATICAGAQQMGRLIDDLLRFSRLSRASLIRQTIDTGRLVRDVAASLGSMQAGRRLELRIGELPPCEADPALLRQVWLNLMANAFKYTGRREEALVEVGCDRDAEGAAVYFVRDNGAGFDMCYAHKLFGVFQRLHRTEDYEGTGVGLAIVQRIVHRHGGRVWAEAAPDCGATFFFTLKAPSSS